MTKKHLNNEEPCEKELLQRILRIVEGKDGQGIHIPPGRKGIYDNQSLMKLLNVSGAYLRKLRDNGYLGFSRHGDKYWYTQEDVDRFIRRFHYEAFAISDVSVRDIGRASGAKRKYPWIDCL